MIRSRRLVTIVFADLVDSTALAERLDPESMHRVLDRYSAVCGKALERHGGTVEKYVGDAAVGVFGLTDVHEDDALRAVRAGFELREATAALSAELERDHGVRLAVKVGVNSGEVFVGGGTSRGTFATGDAIHVAARLEQAAAPNEILLGERTYRLVEDAVVAEALEPLSVKGRSSEVLAWRLVELSAAEPLLSGPFPPPLVGRGGELMELRLAFDRTGEERVCRLCTIVGPAGIGKSRLARELVDGVGGAATTVVGRCASYGEGVTFRPLAEIVAQLVGAGGIAQLLDGDEQAALVERRVLGAIGQSEEPAPPEETFWAIRRLFEAAARERPVIAVVEDVHWAAPMLLDLLEYLVGFSAGSPILLLCLTRPELLETRPSWAAPQPNRPLLVLDALPEKEARALVQALGSDELDPLAAARIVETAEGNPLFLEQLVAAQAESDEPGLPPSLQAVLAARLARLDPGERALLERAAVEGRSFRRGAVEVLVPEVEREAVRRHLMALVRRQLIRPDRAVLAGEDAFRFSHVLIQEAAYHGIPKQLRAELHERLARWLEARPAIEDEIVGYHLEQAYGYRVELGPEGPHERELATEGVARLDAAARKALARGDPAAGSSLLGRAAALLPGTDPARTALLPRLGEALFDAGRLTEADEVLAEAIETAGADAVLGARARVEQQFVRLQADAGNATGEARRVGSDALQVFEERGDDLGQCRAWCLRAWIEWIEGHSTGADEAWGRAAVHARAAGEERELFEILAWRASAAVEGPTPVAEAIRTCTEIREQVRRSPVAVAVTLHPLAALHAMRGEFEEARALIREGNAILDDAGRMQSAVSHHEALVELLAGDPAEAEERLFLGYQRLEKMGEKALLATTAAMLAQATYAQERYPEAERFCSVSESTAAAEDLSTQVIWRGVSAKILARQGRIGEAEALAGDAVRLVAQTDMLTRHGDALLDLAEVLSIGGRSTDADAAVRGAHDLYMRKENVVSAGHARALVASLAST